MKFPVAQHHRSFMDYKGGYPKLSVSIIMRGAKVQSFHSTEPLGLHSNSQAIVDQIQTMDLNRPYQSDAISLEIVPGTPRPECTISYLR